MLLDQSSSISVGNSWSDIVPRAPYLKNPTLGRNLFVECVIQCREGAGVVIRAQCPHSRVKTQLTRSAIKPIILHLGQTRAM